MEGRVVVAEISADSIGTEDPGAADSVGSEDPIGSDPGAGDSSTAAVAPELPPSANAVTIVVGPARESGWAEPPCVEAGASASESERPRVKAGEEETRASPCKGVEGDPHVIPGACAGARAGKSSSMRPPLSPASEQTGCSMKSWSFALEFAGQFWPAGSEQEEELAPDGLVGLARELGTK